MEIWYFYFKKSAHSVIVKDFEIFSLFHEFWHVSISFQNFFWSQAQTVIIKTTKYSKNGR